MDTSKKENINRNILNPITLFVFMVVGSFIVFISDLRLNNIIMIISFFILFMYSLELCVKRVVLYLFLIGIKYLLMRINLGLSTGALLGIIVLVLKLYPIFNIGKIVIGTSPLEMMSALKFLRIPENIKIALVTALRYLGEIDIRIKEIRNGMKIRGLKLSLLHPGRSFELYLVPLIYKCLDVSETLTSSIISRGIMYECNKTDYRPVKFRIGDIVIIILLIIIFGRALWMKF